MRTPAVARPPFCVRRPRVEGFSLLEVILAMAILVLAVATILPLFAVGTTSHKRGMDQANVSWIAPHIAAKIQERLFDVNPADIAGATFSEMGTTYRYDATFEPLDPGDPARSAFAVAITVKWKEAGKEKSEAFTTVLLRRLKR
jgi:uncharacterized protein (TIGR02598 family)